MGLSFILPGYKNFLLMKLWDKGYQIDDFVEQYTVGDDRVLDLKLARYDVIGSRAHAAMLQKIGLLTQQELASLDEALQNIEADISRGDFTIPGQFEDVHSYVEYLLVERLGETGKKIHTARSRNDQVLLDLHLFAKSELKVIVDEMHNLFSRLLKLADQHRDKLLPGYTHMQVAMPSSFGLWFGAYAESLIDDLYLVRAARRVADQNPLGSGAGYGSSFPLDRQFVTDTLGLAETRINVVAAQMSRGKLEQAVVAACATIAATLNKLSVDMCLYMSQNFGFVRFPKELTTGSSIMPHKQNPDVWEVMRARTAEVLAMPATLSMITSGLSSGYHRDFQVLKGHLMQGLELTRQSLKAAEFMLRHISVADDLLLDERYDLLFTVEAVNQLVLQGVPFREAYRQVGEQLATGEYQPDRKLEHSHLGSIGHLGLEEIRAKWGRAVA